jgi:type VI protein secretion system component Hcp
MAFTAYGKIEKAANPPKASYSGSGAVVEVNAEFKNGQVDHLAGDEPGGHESKNGFFRVLHWTFIAQRPSDAAAQAKGGKVNFATLNLVKYFGRLSPLLMQALGRSSYFDFTLHAMQRAGDKATTFMEYKFANCQLIRVRHFVGDGASSASTTLAADRTDTSELEELEMVFQAVSQTGFNKTGSLDFTKL